MNTVYDITTQSYKFGPELSSNNAKGHFSIAGLISAIEEMNNKMRDADNAFSVEQSVNEFSSANKILDEKADAAKKTKMKTIITGGAALLNVGLTGFSTLGLSSFEHGFKREIDFNFSEGSWLKPWSKISYQNPGEEHYYKALGEHNDIAKELHAAKYYGGEGSVAELEEKLEIHRTQFKAEEGYDLLNGVKHQGMHAMSQHVDLLSGSVTALGEFAAMNAASGASADERQAELDGTFEHFFEKDADSYSSKARSVSQQTMQAVESLVGVLGKLQDAMTLK
jgi:hypothetical protein